LYIPGWTAKGLGEDKRDDPELFRRRDLTGGSVNVFKLSRGADRLACRAVARSDSWRRWPTRPVSRVPIGAEQARLSSDMAKIRMVQLATAADGAPIADALRAALADVAAVSAVACPGELPAAHENAVLVFVLTRAALADPAVAAHAVRAAGSRFPCLPVVPGRRDDFDFRALTGDFGFLGRLNAVGWQDGDAPGELVRQAIRRYLGLEPFLRDCRLFVSYRRSDGTDAAQAIYRHFRGLGFDAFLDTEDEAIEPGEEVQPRLHQAIPERDFLLLVDSPDAASSGWVREEVSVALANRVAIMTVRVAGSEGFPQVRDLPALTWGPDEARNLFDLERAVRSRLALRRSFDRRVQQTLAHLAQLLDLRTIELGPRRLLLSLGAGAAPRRCLLEYEDAAYDLARLHRLARGRGDAGLSAPAEPAVLVHRGRGLSAEEQAAVDWACHGEPLQVLALDQVVPFFLSNLPSAAAAESP
jgi:hypothetical protein